MNLGKKLYWIILLLIILVACQDQAADPPPVFTTPVPTLPSSATAVPTSQPQTQETTETASVESTLAKILSRGFVIVGVKEDFQPFGYLDENSELVGFDIDIAREFAKRWLGDEGAVTFVKVTSSDRIPRLVAGEVDLIAASMTHNKERDETIDFSQTYFLDGQSLLVKADSEIGGVSDLDGKKVAAVQGSTSITQIETEAARKGVTIEIVPFLEYAPAVEALNGGQVDALTTDSVALAQFAQENSNLAVVGGRFTQEPYGMGVPQGDSVFRELVNFTLQDMKQDGVYDAIYAEWFPTDTPFNIEVLPGEPAFETLQDAPQEPLAALSTIESILANGRITAGVKADFQPFGYLDDNSELVGFDIDIVREFARRWLGDPNAVDFVKVTSSDRIQRLAAGEVDLVAASMTHRKDREATIDFSQTYFLDGQSLLVQETSGINGVADLDGKKVAAVQGSSSIDEIQAQADRAGITIEVVPFLEYFPAIEALNDGQVDALTTDSVALSQFAQDNRGLAVVGGRFTQEPYGMGLPQGDARFRELVDFTLQEMKQDGAYDRIYRKWFPKDQPYNIEILPKEATYLAVCHAASCVEASGDQVVQGETAVSTIQRIKDRDNTLIVGVKFDFKPFGFLDDSGQVTGFDIDLIQAIADEWGVEVEFVQVTSSDRIPKLAAGEVDIIAASMTHKKGRDEIIDFSQTYFLDGQSLLVRRDSGIESVADLDGKTIAAIQGSTSIDQIQAFADVNGVIIEILPFQEYPPGISALLGGTVDVLTTDSVALFQFAQDNPDLTVVGGLFTEEPYGMGLPADDSYFNNLVNFSLQKLKRDGTYDALYHKWFGDDAEPFSVELYPGEWPYTFADSPTNIDRPAQPGIERMLTARSFAAGVKFDFAPFGFLDGNNDLVGFDVDIMREFAKRWLGDENAVEFVQVTSSDRIEKLAAGQVDILAASMTHTQPRDEDIDFSQTYFLDGQSLLVRVEQADTGEDASAEPSAQISGVADLDGKRIAAIQGSTSINNIQAQADELGITIEIIPFLEYPPAIEALQAGQLDALTTDSGLLTYFARLNPDLTVVGDKFTTEPYGLGLPNFDDGFRDLVNFTLQEMKLDGTYDRLYQKWFGNDVAPFGVEIWPGDTYLDINTVPMLRIPEGEFLRGSNEGQSNEGPEQTILLSEYYIDQYEVTNLLYERCVREEACPQPRFMRSVNFADYFVSPAFRNYPVVWVTWDDAANYCRFVGKRLPTEAEWEKAARGADGLLYPWGDDDPSVALANFGYQESDARSVGSYSGGVSPFGVHDMSGNVREWVSDWHQRDYYQFAPATNPQGPETGVTKVLRGGSWNSDAIYLRTTARRDFLPESFDGSLGFRCVSSTFPPAP